MSTEMFTETSTEMFTETSTEMFTEISTEMSKEMSTEMFTETSTEMFTEISTEMSKEMSTEMSTETSIEMSTEMSTETFIETSIELLNQCIEQIEHIEDIKLNYKLDRGFFHYSNCNKDLTKTQPGEYFEVTLFGNGDDNAFYYKLLSGYEILILQSKYDLHNFQIFEFPK
jgi:hypothetical protein